MLLVWADDLICTWDNSTEGICQVPMVRSCLVALIRGFEWFWSKVIYSLQASKNYRLSWFWKRQNRSTNDSAMIWAGRHWFFWIKFQDAPVLKRVDSKQHLASNLNVWRADFHASASKRKKQICWFCSKAADFGDFWFQKVQKTNESEPGLRFEMRSPGDPGRVAPVEPPLPSDCAINEPRVLLGSWRFRSRDVHHSRKLDV